MQEVDTNLGEEDRQESANHKSLRDVCNVCFISLLLLANVAGLITFVRYLRANTGERKPGATK